PRPQSAQQAGLKLHQDRSRSRLPPFGGMPMTSIRSRLLTILIASTGLIWLFAVAWIYISTQAEVERVLDARLTEAARMVNSLLAERKVEMALATETAGDAPVQFQFGDASYERQLSCQIWSLDG